MIIESTKRSILRLSDKELREYVEAIKTSLNPTVVEMCRFITSVLAGRQSDRIVGWTFTNGVKRNLTQGDVDAMTADWAACARTEQDTDYREQLAAEFGDASALAYMQREQEFRAAMRDVRQY